jgi:hypothetical protein
MILQLLDRKMVKRSPFPVYFALIPLVVIKMQGLVEATDHSRGVTLGSIKLLTFNLDLQITNETPI